MRMGGKQRLGGRHETRAAKVDRQDADGVATNEGDGFSSSFPPFTLLIANGRVRPPPVSLSKGPGVRPRPRAGGVLKNRKQEHKRGPGDQAPVMANGLQDWE